MSLALPWLRLWDHVTNEAKPVVYRSQLSAQSCHCREELAFNTGGRWRTGRLCGRCELQLSITAGRSNYRLCACVTIGWQLPVPIHHADSLQPTSEITSTNPESLLTKKNRLGVNFRLRKPILSYEIYRHMHRKALRERIPIGKKIDLFIRDNPLLTYHRLRMS